MSRRREVLGATPRSRGRVFYWCSGCWLAQKKALACRRCGFILDKKTTMPRSAAASSS